MTWMRWNLAYLAGKTWQQQQQLRTDSDDATASGTVAQCMMGEGRVKLKINHRIIYEFDTGQRMAIGLLFGREIKRSATR